MAKSHGKYGKFMGNPAINGGLWLEIGWEHRVFEFR
jgi:hypothetical protein